MTKSDDWKDACYEQDEADRRAAEREMDRAEDLADRRKDAVQDWRGDWKDAWFRTGAEDDEVKS